VEKARSLIWDGKARCPMLGVAWPGISHTPGALLSLAALFWGVIQRVVNDPGRGPYRTQSDLPFPSPLPACHHARRNFSPFPLGKSAALIGLGRLYRARERSTD